MPFGSESVASGFAPKLFPFLVLFLDFLDVPKVCLQMWKARFDQEVSQQPYCMELLLDHTKSWLATGSFAEIVLVWAVKKSSAQGLSLDFRNKMDIPPPPT